MHNISKLFAFTIMAAVAPAHLHAQPIPVYPGSVLDVENAPAPQCCDFSTADSMQKVGAFYEKALGSPVMTIDEAAAKYPALSEDLARLKKLIPAGVVYRALALPVPEGGKKDAPQLFELLGAAGLVNYTIAPESLSGQDIPFVAEFEQRTGKKLVTPEKEEEKREAEKAARERSAKEDALWRKTLKAENAPLYPDAVFYRSNHQPAEGAEPTLGPILGIYESYSLYEKIFDFYRAKMHQISEEGIAARRRESPFRYAEDATSRSYTAKSRAGTGRSYFTGSGCVDVALIEGKGSGDGAKITKIVFDYNPDCGAAPALVKTLSGE